MKIRNRQHLTRKTEVVEIYDGHDRVCTIIPGPENNTALTRSVTIFSKYITRGYEIVIFSKEPIGPVIDVDKG